jgi:hypothetical protein
LWVGFPAVEAILGQRVIPGLLDRYLAYFAYAGQHTDEPLAPDHRDNLYAPLPGDPGVHGRFDACAANSSGQLWANTHRAFLAGAAIALTLLVAAGRKRLPPH